MIEGRRVLAVITARGGSKGVPRKNVRDLAGKPLIAWTIDAAKESRYLDRTILSSDDAEIIAVARQWGCEVPFIRPDELARDETPGIEPLLHALENIPDQFEYVVLLQPTSPLRTAADIDCCIERCVSLGAPACVSVTEPDKSPYWMYTLDAAGRLHSLLEGDGALRRQDLPAVYALNGAVYVAERSWLIRRKTFITEETIACLMSRERSLDIDTELDFRVCELLLKGSPTSTAGMED